MNRIVALHGFLGRPSDWADVEKYFSEYVRDCEFQTVDLQSAPLVKSKNLKDWAKKFNQLQKSKHVERNIPLGYSMGGRLALHAALDKPGLWDKVILVSAHPGLSLEFRNAQPIAIENRREIDRIWATKFESLPWGDLLSEWNHQKIFEGSEEPLRIESEYRRGELAHMLIEWSLANHEIRENDLEALKPKLMWYAGDRDSKYLNLFQNLRDIGFIDGLHVVADSGHRVIFDNPTEFASKLVSDLNL